MAHGPCFLHPAITVPTCLLPTQAGGFLTRLALTGRLCAFEVMQFSKFKKGAAESPAEVPELPEEALNR